MIGSPKISQIQAIIRGLDAAGDPKKEWLNQCSIAASVAYALPQELIWKRS